MKQQEFNSVLREVIKEELHEWDEPGIDFGGDGYTNDYQRAYAHSQATTPRHNDTKEAIELARKGKFVVLVSDDVHCKATDALLGQCVSIHKVFDNINDAQTEAERLYGTGQDVNLITPDSVKKMDEPEQPEALEPGDDVPFQESDDVDQLDDEPEGSYDPESPEFDAKKFGGDKPRPSDYKENIDEPTPSVISADGNDLYLKMLDIANLDDPSYRLIHALRKAIAKRVTHGSDLKTLKDVFNKEFGGFHIDRDRFNDAWTYYANIEEGYGAVYTKDIKKDPKHTTNKVTGKVNRWTVKFNEGVEKTKPEYADQLKLAWQKAKKEKNVEAMAYYELLSKSNSVANVGFERFKNSWAYERWLKNPKVQEKINQIKDNMKRFSYLGEQKITTNEVKSVIKELIDEMWADIGNISGDTQKDGPTGRATEPGSDRDLVDLYKGGKPDSIGSLPSIGGAMSENASNWNPQPKPINVDEVAQIIFKLREGEGVWFGNDREGRCNTDLSDWIEKRAAGEYYEYIRGMGNHREDIGDDDDVMAVAKEIADNKWLKWYVIQSIPNYKKSRDRYDQGDDQAIGDYEKYGPDPIRWQDVTEGPEYEKWLKDYKGEKCPKCGEFHPAGKGGMKILNPSNPTVNQCGKCKHKWNPDNKTTKPLYEAKGMTSKQKLRSIITESVQEVLKEYSEQDELKKLKRILTLSQQSLLAANDVTMLQKSLYEVGKIVQDLIKTHESGKGYDVPVNVKEKTALGVTQETISKTKNLLDSMLAARKKKQVKVRIYNKTLDPNIWDDNMNLLPDVRVRLLKIAQDFYKGTELKAPIVDIFFLGSTANYNWTPESDIDVHVIIDLTKENIPPEHARQYMDGLGSGWNTNHEIEVKGHPVEVYLQDQTEKNGNPSLSREGSSMYSLLQNKWLKKPDPNKISIDKEKIKQKYHEIDGMVNEFVSTKNVDKLKKLMKAIKNYRNAGLAEEGEFSTENLVFKALRHTGVITKLKDSINTIYDKSVSLTEIQKKSNFLVVGDTNGLLQVTSKIDYTGAVPGSNLSTNVKHGDFTQRGYKDSDEFEIAWRYKSKNNTLYWWIGIASNYEKVRNRPDLWEDMKETTIDHLRKKYGAVNPKEVFGPDRYDSEAHYVNETIDKKSNLFLGFIRKGDFKVVGTSVPDNQFTHDNFQFQLGTGWRELGYLSYIPWRYKRSTNTIYWWDPKLHPNEDEKKEVEYWLEKNVNIKYPEHRMITNWSPDEPQKVADRWASHTMSESKFDPFTAKSLEFVTYGGLSLTKQKGFGASSSQKPGFTNDTGPHDPPARRGIYAFVWPYIERFLLGGGYADPKQRGKGQRQRATYVKDKEGNVITSDHPDYKKHDEKGKNWSFSRTQDNKPWDNEKNDWEKETPKQVLYNNANRKKFKYNGPLWHHLGDYVKEDRILDRKGIHWVKTDMNAFQEALKKELHKVMTYDRSINKGKPFRGLGISSHTWDGLEVFIDQKI